MKRIKTLLKIAGMKFEIKNLLEIHFYKRQVSFLVLKTVKCKRGISFTHQRWFPPAVVGGRCVQGSE